MLMRLSILILNQSELYIINKSWNRLIESAVQCPAAVPFSIFDAVHCFISDSIIDNVSSKPHQAAKIKSLIKIEKYNEKFKKINMCCGRTLNHKECTV